ncbi:hypothetical protein BW723_06945 [Polaribacter reichenbachii]|uniref:DoxX family protein n=1 Tax=Polaribacter reichenbachii TaxID=996801 RepID=A0A1B8U5V0_9FLAO|nr:DoxX family protein [Polaribacter reichenbachii]APZ46048.1 hypothetical protein BW723_06945 [Polaribacter reichenbachii]AUC19910.1 hypothetical protein BTO17_14965 [Polaribacter reichenbachii]OBY67235.1 hypothetical protein LPB301_02545 [Polaribacter reichenbachii]
MTTQKTNKVLNIVLWIAQVLVALMLLWGGYAKLATPLEELSKMMPWAAENQSLLTFTGIIDVLGGLGLLLPSLLKIKPQFTVYAAYGTMTLMVAAAIFHISRGEYEAIAINIIIFLIALFVAWGRTKKAPILPKI